MKSKLLQKVIYDVNQSREVVDGHRENIEGSSVPWRERETPPNRVNPAFDAEAGKEFPALLKRNYRSGRSYSAGSMPGFAPSVRGGITGQKKAPIIRMET
jgi:hypothetical protein